MTWVERELKDQESPAQLSKILNDIPMPLARALVLRGIDTFDSARRYFRATLSELNDPFELSGMPEAADRLARAIRQNEQVLICGDFDADGVTSTALLLDFLSGQGCKVSYAIPDRFTEGYGFHPSGVDKAIEAGATLVVVVDCGTASVDTADYAAEHNLDVIICDHHENNGANPQCLAHINPKRAECSYAFKEMCACGLAYNLVLATLDRLGKSPDQAKDLLDLVAIGTVADVVPLEDENRILVREGLEALRNTQRPGLRSLVTESRLSFEKLGTSDIGMRIGPLLNAAGRLEDAAHAVELLRTSASEAEQHARKLDQLNEARKTQSSRVESEANKLAKKQLAGSHTHVLVLLDTKWHPGVLGPAASQIARKYHRPTLLLTARPPETVRNPQFITGSARSIDGVNIHDTIASCSDLLTKFGGHAQAAGVTLETVNYQLLRQRMNAYVANHCDADALVPRTYYDADLDLADISPRFMSVLRQFEPTGKDNESPVFRVGNVYVETVRITAKGNHLQLQIRGGPPSGGFDRTVPRYRCIAFRQGFHYKKMEQARQDQMPVELLCAVEENTYMGRTSTQLRIEQIRLQNSDRT